MLGSSGLDSSICMLGSIHARHVENRWHICILNVNLKDESGAGSIEHCLPKGSIEHHVSALPVGLQQERNLVLQTAGAAVQQDGAFGADGTVDGVVHLEDNRAPLEREVHLRPGEEKLRPLPQGLAPSLARGWVPKEFRTKLKEQAATVVDEAGDALVRVVRQVVPESEALGAAHGAAGRSKAVSEVLHHCTCAWLDADVQEASALLLAVRKDPSPSQQRHFLVEVPQVVAVAEQDVPVGGHDADVVGAQEPLQQGRVSLRVGNVPEAV
mmetsp:Transcript_77901/g.137340  ORF Transcript_77901/g.137340 Transcript_77901/m.137340 type:complete len:269 (-) Transcript_77901:619-1425(-)